MYLSVIIPAYNEAKRIGATLNSVSEYLKRQSYEYEIVVVNDGSHDATSVVVTELAREIPGLRLIDNASNHGKGWAVRQGMLAAHGTVRLFMDADNSTTVDQVEQMLPYFDQGVDIVAGSRRIAGAVIAIQQPWYRDILGGLFRLIVHTLVQVGLTDTQAGFKAFSASATQIIFSQQTIFRWAFDVEILAIARQAKLKIVEMPIVWKNDSESHVKFSGMIAMLFEVLKVRYNIWSGRYR